MSPTLPGRPAEREPAERATEHAAGYEAARRDRPRSLRGVTSYGVPAFHV
ncbi:MULTISPECIES: hypothetical protein [unclassified Streptomyces]|nr:MULTISPECIES: hypothetical protein [unclassified Streptomyces]